MPAGLLGPEDYESTCMSTTEIPGAGRLGAQVMPHPITSFWEALKSNVQAFLRPLASLKLTVALFSLSFVLIIVGTLAQYEKNMWQVLSDYFRTYIAWVDFHIFLPPSFFPHAPRLPGGFFFPGGKSLGILLMVNLFAAHAIRFKVQAKARQRIVGWLVFAAGLLLTLIVILASSSRGGVQGEPLISFDNYWQILRFAGVALFAVMLYATVATAAQNRFVFWLRIAACVAAGALCLVLIAWGGSHRLSDASMRILWQLGQSLVAASVVMAGSLVLFRKRAGVVVLHLGVALLMLGEMIVALYAVEQRISLVEGNASSFARQSNKLELAIVDTSNPNYDEVIAIPFSRIRADETVAIPELDATLRLVDFHKNSRLVAAADGDTNPATAGHGQQWIAKPARSSGGADPDQKEDVASAYVEIVSQNSDIRQTYLLSQWINDVEGLTFGQRDRPEPITLGDTTYQFALRSQRNYKPYTIRLLDVQSKSYLGTTRPKDYSSYVDLVDEAGIKRLDNYRIWINNPLRFGGETFYQSGYHPIPRSDGGVSTEASTLAVVSNQGWMIPYVACGYVFLGMLFHFGNTLIRFLRRQSQEERHAAGSPRGNWIISLGVVAIFASVVIYAARPDIGPAGSMDLSAFARLPVLFEGRAQPIDTLARTMLKSVSNKQSYRETSGDEQPYEAAQGPRRTALMWLLDVATRSESARTARVFRIENLATLEMLGLQRRKGLSYSIDEFKDQLPALQEAVAKARKLQAEDPLLLNNDQRKMIETADRLQTFMMLQDAFTPTEFPPLPDEEAARESPEQADQQFRELTNTAMQAVQRAKMARQSGIPLIIPGATAEDWLPFGCALDRAYLGRLMQGTDPDKHVVAYSQILDAYSRDDADEFNHATSSYYQQLKGDTPAEIDLPRIDFEVFFNRVQPFLWSMIAYLTAFLMVVLSWMVWHRPLQQASFWLIAATLVLHTTALIARIYISQRPPVTTLYSSAIFIGWGAVLFGLLFELIFRLGIGHIVSAVAGFVTLLIAHNLGLNGDTFVVLQAVLDTQFWLATHVVCITMGYVATFVAGLFSIALIINRYLPKHPLSDKSLSKIIYGTICFAMFFSFVGTVLGGLWADDSWGRFWGWDPKENGALMIVLWNAIILHARWDGMIRERGVAVLAVLGNIVTAWSWFGVNELGIGLHSYGFTEGTLLILALFATSQIVIATLGVLSSGTRPDPPATAPG